MLSKILQFCLILLGLAPVVLLYGLVNLADFFVHYQIIFLPITKDSLFQGLDVFIEAGGLYLLGFFILMPLSKMLLNFINKNLEIRTIEAKQIKSYDFQMNAIYLSYILPFAKFTALDWNAIYTFAFIAILLVISWSNRRTYNTNVFLSLFLNYRHYEVQTRAEVTFIMLSKRMLINTKEIPHYIQLTDYVILDPET